MHLRHPNAPSAQAGAVLEPEAAAYTTSRLFGQVVRLEDDVERHDIYGRRSRTCTSTAAISRRSLRKDTHAPAE